MSQSNTWTLKSVLDWMCGYLQRKGDESPRLSAEWLLSAACGLKRIDLYLYPDRPLDKSELDCLHGFVERRGKGEPLQYITGEAPFRYLQIKVREGVLIPRPETEVLVSEALACLPAQKKREGIWSKQEAKADEVAEASYLVADICTGSGCIACALASERPDLRVFASDISVTAIDLARENVEALGLSQRISLFQGDLGEALPNDLVGQFDLVVSNPPYVPHFLLQDLPYEVSQFEPASALDGGEDGLDLFRPLLSWAKKALSSQGSFVCELYEGHLESAASFAREAGFASVRIVNDLTQRPRVLVCQLSAG